MKCRVCGKRTSEYSDGYCLRCEKIAADVDIELFAPYDVTVGGEY